MDSGSVKRSTSHILWRCLPSHHVRTGQLIFCLTALITATDSAFASCPFSPSGNNYCCSFETITGPHPHVEVGSLGECMSIAKPFADEIAANPGSYYRFLPGLGNATCIPAPGYTTIESPVTDPQGFFGQWVHWGYTCMSSPPVLTPDLFLSMYMYRFAQHNYRIQLSNISGSSNPDFLAEVEPGEGINTLSATVYDSNNQPQSGISVTLRADVVPLSGGHSHPDDNRPKGNLGGSPPIEHILERKATGPDGAVHFTFQAPKVAGDHTITANCDDVNCGSDTGKVWVGIRGLVSIPSSGFWNLYGDTGIHPAGHYLTGDAFGKLMDLAQLYTQVYFPLNTPVLQLNDASLERGGVFDIDWVSQDAQGNVTRRTEWWTPPHKEHQRGVVIDIQANGSATAIPDGNFPDFESLMRRRLGMSWLYHDGHYHVRLLGVAQ
jgi:hypothetical protein